MSVSLTELGVPTLHVRKAGAIAPEQLTGDGGGVAIPTTAQGHVATAPQKRLFTQTVMELSANSIPNAGTMTVWFKVMPDVSVVKIWFNSDDASPDMSFALSDRKSGSLFTNTSLAAQTGAQIGYYMLSDLEAVPWIRVVYSNNSGGFVDPTEFFCTQVTGMAGAVSEAVSGTIA